jgi:DNA-binding transcriptional regulator YiaG
VAKQTKELPPSAPARPLAEPETFGQAIARTYAAIRAQQIREMRARKPQPSYDQIAREMGVCVKTVSNVLTGKTHGPDA